LIVREIRRSFRRSPLLTVLACLILALGFAGSTAAFTVMAAISRAGFNGLLPLSFGTLAEETVGGASRALPWPAYEYLSTHIAAPGLTMAAYGGPVRVRLLVHGESREISVSGVSASFFQGFTRGSLFLGNIASGWDSGAGDHEVVLTESLASHSFGSGNAALGQTVTLNGGSYRVIGVAPRGFAGLWAETDAWVAPEKMIALGNQTRAVTDPLSWKITPIFFVLTASSAESNRSALEHFVHTPENLRFHLHYNDGLTKDPVQDARLRNWAQLTFLVAVTVILAAGLNYAALLLAQAPRQAEEIRLKRILGAGTLSLILEGIPGPAFVVFTSFLLAVAGTALALTFIGKEALALLPAGSISWQNVMRIFAIEFGAVWVLAVAIALVPALRLLREAGAPRLGYTSTGGKWAGIAMRSMVALQMASCLVMCLLAWTMVQAVRVLSDTTLGFEPGHLTAIEIGPVTKNTVVNFQVGGDEDFPFATFTRGVLQGARESTPDLRSVAAASCAPFGQAMKALTVQRLDQSATPSASIHYCGVTQSYFQTMGNPVYRGRGFSRDEFIHPVTEAIVNRQLARELWPGQDPLHRSIRIEDPNSPVKFDAEIVGIVDDMRFAGVTSSPEATLFLPLRENVFALAFPLYFLLKGNQSPVALSELIRQQAVVSMPTFGVTAIYRVDERLETSFLEQKARTFLPVTGAIMVALIAYLGLYAVLMYAVNSRRREIAVRLCFGASRWDIRRTMLRQALECAMAALGLSLIGWRVLVQLATRQWIGSASWSWTAVGTISVAILTISIGIAMVPANAAARTSPAQMLKED
jgi:predicted permease